MSDKIISLCYKTNLRDEYIPKDLEWIDDIEPLKEFFCWLTNCVSDQNCITPEELNTYKVLSESGKFEGEEEDPVKKNYPPENISVYPHDRDLNVLEDLYRQNQIRLANLKDYFEIIKANEKTVDYSKIDCKVDQMLENEVRRVNCLIAGEYRRSALSLATKCSQLNENLKNISESVNYSDLICLSNMNAFCDLMEYLSLYISNIIEVSQREVKKGGSVPSSEESHDFSSPEFFDANLKRIFEDCVQLKALCVERQSQIEGVNAICHELDSSDLFSIVTNCNQPDLVITDDLYTVCYDHVKAEFLKYEVKCYKDKQTKRQKILESLQNLKSLARPLRLCGDSIILLIKDEYKWIRVARAILSDCLGALKEQHLQIEQSYKQLRNIRTVHELSSASHGCPDVSSTFFKLFESRCDVSALSHNDTASSVGSTWTSDGHDKKVVESVMTKAYTARVDSTFKMMKSFSDDIIKMLSHARTIYCYLFNGPSATMPLDSDLISSIIKISQELKSKKDELEKLDCRRLEIEIHRRNDERHDLMEKFWLLYLQDPQQLRQKVEVLEARSKHSRNYHLASKHSDSDCLEKFLL